MRNLFGKMYRRTIIGGLLLIYLLFSFFFQDNNGRIAINLGYWNEEKHFEWVEKNPSKIPRPKGSRK